MLDPHIIKLIAIFAVIVAMLWLRRSLFEAVLAATVATALLYGIGPAQCARLVWQVCTDWSAMSIVVVLYLITFLQRMLERREQIRLAQQDLNGLFNNRRINASVAPLFIGLLPSAAAMILCGDIVKESTDGYLDKTEQAFVTSWFRHIPESTLPTYSGVLLMVSLSGVNLAHFIMGMTVPMLSLFLFGYWFFLRKLPRDTGAPPSHSKRADALHLLCHLWSLLGILVLILGLGCSVVSAVGIIIVLAAVFYRFHLRELRPMLLQAVEVRMLANTFLILVFKEFIAFSGLMNALPQTLARLPLPTYLVFALLFFFGAVVSGTNGIIALGTTMAMNAIPGSGVPLMVLLMCICHAAGQVSPVHLCLAVVTEYYGITLGALVKKTLPVLLLFCAAMLLYYHLLLLVF